MATTQITIKVDIDEMMVAREALEMYIKRIETQYGQPQHDHAMYGRYINAESLLEEFGGRVLKNPWP